MKSIGSKRLTIPIFVSSTFKDMQAERDFLKNIVIHKLEEDELNKRRIKLQLVDLRWGVDTSEIEDESERENTVLKVCLDEIKRCRPFFIGLLGDRYGWCPDEKRMDAVTKPEGIGSSNKDKSVTALEIEFGVLASPEQLKHSVFYFREMEENEVPDEKRSKYFDAYDLKLSQEEKDRNKRKLQELKEDIEKHVGEKGVKTYTAHWDDTGNKIGGLEAWGEIVYKDILREVNERAKETWDDLPENWMEEEQLLLDNFVDRHAGPINIKGEEVSAFCGRKTLISQLKGHLTSHDPKQWGLVLTGESGSGKSAVFSKLYLEMLREPGLVLAHSAGLSPRSRRVSDMLQRWVRQLGQELGETITEWGSEETEKEGDHLIKQSRETLSDLGLDAPQETRFAIDELVDRFRELLYLAAEKEPVYLMIDALDQFEPTKRARYMTWLPKVLPAGVSVVCTAITGTDAKAREYHKSLQEHSLENFSRGDAAQMLDRLCEVQHKTLNPLVRKALLDKEDANRVTVVTSPLWLKLAANALMAMDQEDFEEISKINTDSGGEAIRQYMLEFVKQLPGRPGALFLSLIQKAGTIFGMQEVARTIFDLLACTRNGLRESDLEQVVPDVSSMDWDPLAFSNLRRWFRGLVVNRGEEQQWDLGHSILRRALLEEIDQETKLPYYKNIAEYLLGLSASDQLRMREIMYHMMEADMRKEAAVYYGGELPTSAESTCTAFLAETIEASAEGINWMERLIRVSASDLENIKRLSSRIIYGLNDQLAEGGNLDERIQLLEQLKDKTPLSLQSTYDFASMLGNLGGLYQARGEFDRALDYFEKRSQLGKELYELNPGNEGLKNGLAISYSRLGGLYQARGEFDRALDYFEKRSQLGKELYASNPGNEGLKNGLAISYERLGELYQARGAFDRALDYFEKEVNLFIELYASNPGNEGLKNGLAISYEKLGGLYQARGEFDRALDYFEKRSQLGKELYESNPGNEGLKNGLAISYEKLGGLYQARGEFDRALDYFEKDNELSKELYASNPGNEGLKNGLAISYSKLGGLYQARGAFDRALDYFEKYNELSKELNASNPGNEGLKNSLTISYSKLGDLYQARGAFDRALDYFEKYNELSKELYASNPGNEGLKNGLTISYSNLGELYQARGEFDRALVYFEKAVNLFIELYESNPGNEGLKNGLAISYSKLGELYQARGEFDRALDYFGKEVNLFIELYASNPGNEGLKNGLAISYEKLGGLYQARGEFDRALDYFEKRSQLSKELNASNPGNEGLKNGLAISYGKLGGLYQARGEFDRALDYFEKCAKLSKELYASNPGNIQIIECLGLSDFKLGELKIQSGYESQGMEHLRKAANIFYQLSQDVDNPMYRNWYVQIKRMLGA